MSAMRNSIFYADRAEEQRQAALAAKDRHQAANHSYLAERYETLARLYQQLAGNSPARRRGRRRATGQMAAAG